MTSDTPVPTHDAMTSLDIPPRYEKLPPEDVVTPERARAELAPLLERATLD